MDYINALLEVSGITESRIDDILDPYFEEGLVEYMIESDEIQMIWEDDYAYDDAISSLEKDMTSAGARIKYSGYS